MRFGWKPFAGAGALLALAACVSPITRGKFTSKDAIWRRYSGAKLAVVRSGWRFLPPAALFAAAMVVLSCAPVQRGRMSFSHGDREMIEKCERGHDTMACEYLGMLAAPHDQHVALDYFHRACADSDTHNGFRCLAYFYEVASAKAPLTPEEFQRAREDTALRCRGMQGARSTIDPYADYKFHQADTACRLGAALYEREPTDPRTVRELLEINCYGQLVDEGCQRLRGLGVTIDEARYDAERARHDKYQEDLEERADANPGILSSCGEDSKDERVCEENSYMREKNRPSTFWKDVGRGVVAGLAQSSQSFSQPTASAGNATPDPIAQAWHNSSAQIAGQHTQVVVAQPTPAPIVSANTATPTPVATTAPLPGHRDTSILFHWADEDRTLARQLSGVANACFGPYGQPTDAAACEQAETACEKEQAENGREAHDESPFRLDIDNGWAGQPFSTAGDPDYKTTYDDTITCRPANGEWQKEIAEVNNREAIANHHEHVALLWAQWFTWATKVATTPAGH